MPKGTFVAWRAGEHRTVSRVETLGMGGLFLHISNPLPQGTNIQLLVDLKTGEVRARGTVRYSSSGKGMGVQFVEMQQADRARLYQFLLNCVETDAESSPKPAGWAVVRQIVAPALKGFLST